MPVYYRKKKPKSPVPVILGALAIIVILFLVFRTRQPEPEAQPTKEAPITQPTDSIALITPTQPAPQVFSDRGQQRQFESTYSAYYSVFVPPSAGAMVRIVKRDGTSIDGELMRISETNVTVSTPDGYLTVARDELSDKTRQELFRSDFSHDFAKARIVAGGVAGATIRELVLPGESSAELYSRRFSANKINARFGPGHQFAVIPEAEIFRGQVVHVVQETNAWICVRTDDARSVIGWIPKFSSFVLTPEKKEVIQREIAELTDAGLLIMANPAKNEAFVDVYEWKKTDPEALEGVCRLLAFYCGQQKNSRLYWVDVKDALTNKRLAEYSESKGIRLF